MKEEKFERMDLESLWALHSDVSMVLALRLAAEKEVVEARLKRLDRRSPPKLKPNAKPRSYPPVVPQFRNPDSPTETWAGRGKQPRWLTEQLNLGRALEEFRIAEAAE